MNAPNARAFDVVTVVWGTEFRQLFLDVCVPNQLTPGNLGALPAGSRYRIFTSAEDIDALNASAAVRQAREVLPVDIVAEPESAAQAPDRFRRMTASHEQALADAAQTGAALIFLSPDLVMSEGTLAAVARRHGAGSRAVVCAGLRVNRETFLRAVDARGGVRAIPSRELVSLALGHLHPFTRAHMIDNEPSARSPISVYWTVPGEGILARCLYMHPLMVDPVRRDATPGGTVDQHFLAHACPAREDIHAVSDSDELAVFEMSHVDAADTDMDPEAISAWRTAMVLSRCDAHQRSYWTNPIRLHVGDIGAAWNSVERQSAQFASRAIWLRLPALWLHPTSRRVRPVRRRAGAFRKQLRTAARRWSRKVSRRARPA